VTQLLFSVADAAVQSGVAAAPELDAAAKAAEQLAANKTGFLGGIANLLEGLLEGIDGVLAAAHVPYSYGFSIIVLTLLVKAATFPLSKKQIESTAAMQAMQPRVKELQVRSRLRAGGAAARAGSRSAVPQAFVAAPSDRPATSFSIPQARYANDQETLQRETALMYQKAGVNPLAGCLPTLATLPVRHRRLYSHATHIPQSLPPSDIDSVLSPREQEQVTHDCPPCAGVHRPIPRVDQRRG